MHLSVCQLLSPLTRLFTLIAKLQLETWPGMKSVVQFQAWLSNRTGTSNLDRKATTDSHCKFSRPNFGIMTMFKFDLAMKFGAGCEVAF